ncbi:hypothetical protein GE09DRAFT_1220405 [Coniochaeta sp. 2T2.1]|nr:hypothetical protein GE09DRAFT_1220405 [Coniochaeta sp. 2T2.1]
MAATRSYISCPALLSSGAPCTSKFTRPWNLKRHLRDFHEADMSPPLMQPVALIHAARTSVAPDDNREPPPTLSRKRTSSHAEVPPAKRARHEETTFPHATPTPSTAPEAVGQTTAPAPPSPLGQLDIDSTPSEQHSQQPSPQSPRCWRGFAAAMPSMPRYGVRSSAQQPGQPKALAWLSQAAKDTFTAFQTRALAKWGVTPDHDGTCVMDPADWANLDPIELMETLTHRTSPTAHSQNRTFKYDDHSTNVPRANAWFGSWPHSGVELDNFLGDGPFKAMQGSHLCHHDNCIVPAHVVYEAADVNADRKDCHKLALRLRSSGREVPARCETHHPPCLLRHAALSTFEVYLLQFHVLRMARQIPDPPSPHTPRWHLFPTFETSLPVRLPVAEGEECPLTASHLAPGQQYGTPVVPVQTSRPQLKCGLCVRTKAFVRLTPLWSHVVQQHDDLPDEERLAEVRGTARLWQLYWRSRDNGKAEKLTLARMNEALGPRFSWEDVVAWDLR